MQSNYSYPEPPLPIALQDEIEASVERFKRMWPAFLQPASEAYVPRYRAEITTVLRKAYRSGHLDGLRVIAPRAETPVQRETEQSTEKAL
jgi:hypothetical protein